MQQPAEVVAPSEPTITAEKFARSIKNRELGAAWLHVEKLSQKSTRKLTKAAWQALYDAWLTAPRG